MYLFQDIIPQKITKPHLTVQSQLINITWVSKSAYVEIYQVTSR